ncbi:MAG: type IV pilus modification PilV family protein [Coraliomargarita sp.]
MYQTILYSKFRRSAFTLVEVVLALGIFLVTVLALVGLLGPTLKSVSEVENTDEVISVVNSLNAFLQNSPEIAGNSGNSKFQEIYEAVANDGHATVFVFKAYVSDPDGAGDLPPIGVQIAFADGETQANLQSQQVDFTWAAGQIYRVVLSASSVIPETLRSATRNGDGIYTLNQAYATYPEGYFAMEARIFGREEDMTGLGTAGWTPASTAGILSDLNKEEPLFTYNTAIVR